MRILGGGGLAVFVAVVALGGCGSSALAEDDPEGYQACLALRQAQDDSADARQTMQGLFTAGRHASESTTSAIRASSKDLGFGEYSIANADKLTAACDDAGVSVD
jgi:hypothetical protein